MNLRILKKLSKRAAPYLPLLGDRREQFLAAEGENYHGLVIRARKHFERTFSIHTDLMREGEFVIAPRCRAGSRYPYVKVYPPFHPWAGTVMVGAMTGYEEPEWDEETAYCALLDHVRWHFVEYEDGDLVPTRRLWTPRDVFAAADDMVRERAA